jgi:hypothetical protein
MNATASAQTPLSLTIPLVKLDVERRLVIGRAAQEVPDKAREIMDYASAKPAFEEWSKGFADATGGLSKGNLRVMHSRHVAGKIQDIQYNDEEKAVDIVAHVVDPVDWEKCLKGVYTGFSIGGGYAAKWQDGHLTRYTPRVAEISLVDSPCMPTARFAELVKADGVVGQVELRGRQAMTFAEILAARPKTFAELRKMAAAPAAERPALTFAELRKAAPPATSAPRVGVAEVPGVIRTSRDLYPLQWDENDLTADWHNRLTKMAVAIGGPFLGKADFDESKHERDESGRFTSKDGGKNYGFEDNGWGTPFEKKGALAYYGASAGAAAAFLARGPLRDRKEALQHEVRGINEAINHISKNPRIAAKVSNEDARRIAGLLAVRLREQREIDRVLVRRAMASGAAGAVAGYTLSEPVIAAYREARDTGEGGSPVAGALEGAGLLVAGSQGAFALRDKVRGFLKIPGQQVAVPPSMAWRVGRAIGRHGVPALAGAALGAIGSRKPDAEGGIAQTAFEAGHLVRTGGQILAAAGLGHLAGHLGAAGIAAATKGRVNVKALPAAGRVIGAGIAGATVLDLTARHRKGGTEG